MSFRILKFTTIPSQDSENVLQRRACRWLCWLPQLVATLNQWSGVDNCFGHGQTFLGMALRFGIEPNPADSHPDSASRCKMSMGKEQPRGEM